MKRKFYTMIAALLFTMVTPTFAWKIPENMRKHVPYYMTVCTYVDDNGEPITYYDMNSLNEKWNELQTNGIAFINEESLRKSEPYWCNDWANYDFNKLVKFGLQLYCSKGVALDYKDTEYPYFVMYIYSLRTKKVVQIFVLSDSRESTYRIYSDLNASDVLFQ